jgi:hypothetical protein
VEVIRERLKKVAFEIRCRWHWVAGGLVGFSSAFGAGGPVGGTIAFLAYEIKEDKDTGTKSYKDIWEFACAFFIGLAIMIHLKILRIL